MAKSAGGAVLGDHCMDLLIVLVQGKAGLDLAFKTYAELDGGSRKATKVTIIIATASSKSVAVACEG